MKRSLVLLLGAGLALLQAKAVPVTPEQASVAARNWLRKGYGFERQMGTDVESVRTLAGTNGSAYHVAVLKGGGFVVVGSDTENVPVVAVSAEGNGVPDERNPLWILLRRDLAARMRAKSGKPRPLRAAASPASGSLAESRWAELLDEGPSDDESSSRRKILSASSGRTTIADVRVEPLVKSAWSQTDCHNYGSTSGDDVCYNYYTPYHWPCGCVATAGAQLMRYHSYPTASVAAGTYACKINGSPVNLTMKGGTYDWNAMTLVPADGCSATSREAIGKLTYDVGVSVGMKYWSGGSSSPGYMLSKRFVDRFRYANAACVIFKDGFFKGDGYSYSLERLKTAVIPNFDAGLPVVLEISGAGGHAVVGDGYGYSGGDFFIHINLGWANKDNGNVWYMPPDIDEYTVIDSVVYNVYPTGASGTSIVSGRVLGPDGAPVEGATVRVFVSEKETVVAKSNAKGIYAFRIAPCKCQVVAEKNGKSSGLDCDIVACISPKIDEDGLYWDSVCPQDGNLYGADMTLEGPDMPDPPPNDDFANASLLTGASGSVTVTNVGATPEANEPLQKSRPAATTTVWWKWTAPANGSMVIAEGGLADGNAFSTVMYAYTGTSLSSLTPVAAGGGPVSTCEFDCTSGTTYYICVAGDKGASGDIFLQWAFTGSSAPEWYYEKISDGGTICARIIAGAKKYAGDLAIPSTLDGYPVREIGAEAFLECVDLTSLTIPQSVTLIREGAFYNCRGLKSVTIPEGVTQIGPAAFAYCHVLEDVTLPSTLQWMGSQVFFNCMGLTNVSIPTRVEYIGAGAFSACANLKTLKVASGNADYKAVGNALYSKDGQTLYHWPVTQHVSIPNGVREIADYAYFCNSREMSEAKVSIPGSVVRIGRYAFENRKIGNLVLQEGVETLDLRAFAGNLMSEVEIPASVTSIGDLCFKDCDRLTKIVFLGDEPSFEGTTGLAGNGTSSPGDVVVSVGKGTSGWRDAAGKWLASWPRNVSYPCRMETRGDDPEPFPEAGPLADELGIGIDVAHGEVAPYANAAAEYNGYLYDEEDRVVGTVQVNVAKGAATATVQLADGTKKLSFKGGEADETGRVSVMTDKDGSRLAVFLGVNGLGGTFRRSAEGVSYRIDGARNFFGGKSSEDKTAAEAAEVYEGTYNVAFDAGTLSVVVDKKGKAKVAGTVDGDAVSASSQLLVGKGIATVPVAISGKSSLAFGLWLSADGEVAIGGGLEGVAGEPGQLEGGASFNLNATAFAARFAGLYADCLPNGLGVVQNGAKWIVADGAKAGKLVLYDKTTGELDPVKSKFTDNMADLKLAYKEKGGTFSGSFKAYAFEGGKIKSYMASVTGVMIGTKGYGTATVKGVGSFAVTISFGVADDDAKYCVIDLSRGAGADAYPVSYLTGIPDGGWTDEYKTTKLVLRAISPGTFRMSDSCRVTLTEPYYMGVFEVTQKQWELVMGSNPSQHRGDMRPVEMVSFEMIRGDRTVSTTSFVGRLRAKTGLNVDLPTEAQWEYASRAGATGDYAGTGNLDEMGCYGRSSAEGHMAVGSFLPNRWGLYDVHGNIWEKCRDWYDEALHDGTDPTGPDSGTERVVRGGGWCSVAKSCRLSARGQKPPSETTVDDGFRLAITESAGHTLSYETFVDGGVTCARIIAGNGNEKYAGDLMIPPTLGGYPVREIADRAFYGCDGLTSLEIPEGVTSIGAGAFAGCRRLLALNVAEGNVAYKSVDDVLYSKDGRTICHWPAQKEVSIPDGVESLGAFAFSGNGAVQVLIPASVKTIGGLCFGSCKSLRRIAFYGNEPSFVGATGLVGDGASDSEGVCVYVLENASGWRDSDGELLDSWPRNVSSPCRVRTWDGAPESFPVLGTIAEKLGTRIDVAHGEVAPYANAAAEYDGYLYDEEDRVVGTVQVNVAKGAATATVQLADGTKKLSFKGGAADAAGHVTEMTDKDGNRLAVSVGVNGLGGAFLCSGEGESYRIDGARNFFGGKSPEDKAAAEAAEIYERTYNVAFDAGTLSVIVDKKGKAKIAGTVGGVAVSASSQLLVGKGVATVPVVISGKSSLAFGLWLSIDRTAEVCGGPEGIAGEPGLLEGGASFNLNATAFAAQFAGLYADCLPNGLGVVQNGAKWIVADGAKAGKLVLYDKTTGELDPVKSKFTDNMADLKLAYKEKGGTFAGSFKVYAFEGGKIKSYTASVTGVMIGTKGYGTATVKGVGSFAVTISGDVSPEEPVVRDAEFCIVDLSKGPSAVAYPVTYRTGAPADGWTDEYKTTKLVLRVIQPGVFTMGSLEEEAYNPPRRVTLTKSYCLGVFEVTQKQWELVMGTNPSYFGGDKRPVESVSYDMVRGTDKGGLWPASAEVDATSFLGKLRARTGLNFDLPTQTQWEYACRAGTTTTYSYGDTPDGDYMWYDDNADEQTHDVGTRLPNPWGLYDMHGNVWEWCRDWGPDVDEAETDPKGPDSGSGRAVRGGGLYAVAAGCTSAAGGFWWPSSETTSSCGFRLSIDEE